MDVIIEGKITSEEGVDEVLRTCAEIKSVKTPILRINDNGSDLQGRIGFSQGGYIVGGKITGTEEVGYEAVRKLLMVTDGNYAILDPLRKHITEINQSLWIKVDRLVPLLPNLPENPDGLVDPKPELATPQGQIDLSGIQKTIEPENVAVEEEGPVTLDAKKSRARKFDIGAWRIFKYGLAVIVPFAAILGGCLYQQEIIQFLSNYVPFLVPN